jgi:hypothetical protein
MTNQQATRMRKGLNGETLEFTNARDESGILVELTSYDIERLGATGVREYRERRSQEVAAAKAQREEAERLETYKQRYVAAGGNPDTAEDAYKAFRAAQAAEAAGRSDEEARASYAATVRSAV